MTLIRINGSTWKVRSFSRAGQTYTVRRVDGKYVCDCPDARYRQRSCKHVAVLEHLIDGRPLRLRLRANCPVYLPVIGIVNVVLNSDRTLTLEIYHGNDQYRENAESDGAGEGAGEGAV